MNLAGIVLFSCLFLKVFGQTPEEVASVVVSGNEEDGQVLNFKDKGEDVDVELAKLNVDNKDEQSNEPKPRTPARSGPNGRAQAKNKSRPDRRTENKIKSNFELIRRRLKGQKDFQTIIYITVPTCRS